MKKYLLIALISICLSTKAQQTPTNKTRSNNDFSQVDNYLIGLKRLGIPTSETDNLDAAGLPQNSVKIIFNTTLGKLRVYNPVVGTWADATNLNDYYTKAQIDAAVSNAYVKNQNQYNQGQDASMSISGGITASGSKHYIGAFNLEGGTEYADLFFNNKDANKFGRLVYNSAINSDHLLWTNDYGAGSYKKVLVDGDALPLSGGALTGHLTLKNQYNSLVVPPIDGDIYNVGMGLDGYGLRSFTGQGILFGRDLNGSGVEISYNDRFSLNKTNTVNRIVFDDLEIRTNVNNKKVLWTGDALPFTGGTLTGKLNINDANDFPIELSGNGVSFGTAFNSTHYGNLGNYFTATSGFLAKLGADMRFEGIANNYNIGMWGDHLAVSSNKGGMIRFIDENIYAYDQGNMRPFLKGNTSTPQNNQLYLGDYNNQMIFDNLGLRGLNNNAFEVGIRMTGGGGLDIGASGAPTKFFQNSEQIFGLYDKIYAYKDIISTGNLSMNTGRGISFADGVGDRVDAIKYKDYGLHIGNVSNVANFTGIHLTGDGSTDAISVYHDNQVGLADFAAPIFNYKLLVRDENGAMRQVAKQDLGYAAMNTANPIGGNLKIESAVVAGSFRTNDNMFSVSTDVANNEITIQQGSSGNINLNGYTIVAANNIQAGGQIKSDSKIISPSYRVSALQIAPATANDSGEAGEIRITAGYIYVCIATNEWVRTSLTTW